MIAYCSLLANGPPASGYDKENQELTEESCSCAHRDPWPTWECYHVLPGSTWPHMQLPKQSITSSKGREVSLNKEVKQIILSVKDLFSYNNNQLALLFVKQERFWQAYLSQHNKAKNATRTNQWKGMYFKLILKQQNVISRTTCLEHEDSLAFSVHSRNFILSSLPQRHM